MNPLLVILGCALASALSGLASALSTAPANVLFLILMLAFTWAALRAIGHFRDDY